MWAIFLLIGNRIRGKHIVASAVVDILIYVLMIEFLKINNELFIIIALGILPRDQEAVLQPIAVVQSKIDVVLFMFMYLH